MSQLNQKVLTEITKLSKEGYIIFYNNKVILLNYIDFKNGSSINIVINLDESLFEPVDYLSKPILFTTQDLLNIKAEKSEVIYTISPELICLNSGELTISNREISVDAYNLFSNIINIEDKLSCNGPVVCVEDLKANERFNEINGWKAANGAGLLTIEDKYNMFLYSNLLPVNKPDKISVEIYNFDDISFLSKFIIKKRLLTLNVYIRFAYLGR